MSNGARVATGVAAGYVLGRFHKLRLALLAGSVLANKRVRTSGLGLLQQGTEQLKSSPQAGRLGQQVSGKLADAAKAAALAVASRQMDSLSDRMAQRSEALRSGDEDEDSAEQESEDRADDRDSEDQQSDDRESGEGEPDEEADEPTDEADDKSDDEPTDEADDESDEEPTDEADDEPDEDFEDEADDEPGDESDEGADDAESDDDSSSYNGQRGRSSAPGGRSRNATKARS